MVSLNENGKPMDARRVQSIVPMAEEVISYFGSRLVMPNGDTYTYVMQSDLGLSVSTTYNYHCVMHGRVSTESLVEIGTSMQILVETRMTTSNEIIVKVMNPREYFTVNG